MFKRIISVIDAAAINIIIFILSFVWIRYYTKNLTMAILLAFAVSVAIYAVYKLTFGAKKEKKRLTKVQEEKIESCITSLAFLDKESKIGFVKKLIGDGNQEIYAHFSFEELTKQNIADAVAALEDGKELIIIAKSFSKSVQKMIDNIHFANIKCIDGVEFLSLMEEKHLFPADLNLQPDKVHISDIIKYAFGRKRAKGYLFTGILLLATSFLIPFKLYYIISGSILLVIALICLGIGE